MDFNKHQNEKENFKIYVEKEIYKTSVTKEINYRLSSGQSSDRNPLSTLSDNVPLRSKTTYNKKVDIQQKKFRTKSTDGVVMKLEYEFEKTEKVRMVQTKNVPREIAAAKKDPPVHINPSTKPPKKIALAKKLSKRFIGTQELFSNCLYDVEYFMDNYHYMIGIEGKYVLRRNYLKEHVDHECRQSTVNWLIQVQEYLNLSEITLFTAVRMTDNFLIKIKTPTEHYRLIAITCIWISSKIHDIHFILASKLSSLCHGTYSKQEMIEMEKKILKTLKFNVNIIEPTPFLFYYINNSSLENNGKVVFGAKFLLEIFLYTIEFSSNAPSLLAATALYLTMQRYNMCPGAFLQSHFRKADGFKTFAQYMNISVLRVLNDERLENEAVKKYAIQARLNVAQYFTIG